MMHWGAVTLIALSFPMLLGFRPGAMDYQFAAATLVFAAIWLLPFLRLLRYEGYRLVWVRRANPNQVFFPNDPAIKTVAEHDI